MIRGAAANFKPYEALVAVRPLHEFVAEPSAPATSDSAQIGDRFQLELARIRAAHRDREGVVEAERRQHIERESLSIFGPHAFEHRLRIVFDVILQNYR
jgi:hypothetical protein